jgi:hypothetical protein
MAPHALCLEQVGYPEAAALAERAAEARRVRTVPPLASGAP